MDQDHNPYAPPAAGTETAPLAAATGYADLGWRTAVASVALVADVGFSVLLHGLQIAHGDAGVEDVGGAVAIGLAALGVVVSALVAIVFYCIWIYRAAANLPALGRYGMTNSPGWCVGWFFVPFLNLVRPYRCVDELWLASDPEGSDDAWALRPRGQLIGLWWGTWLAGNVIANIGSRIKDGATQGAVGMAGSLFTVVAAVACIGVMRGITERQRKLAARPVQ